MTSLAVFPIKYGGVAGQAVLVMSASCPTQKNDGTQWVTYIPNNNRSGSPANATLKILRQSNVVIQEFEQIIRLFLLVPDDIPSD